MTTRLLLLTGVFFMAFTSINLAQSAPPAAIGVTSLDQTAVDTLKEVHNRGAELYNAGDHAGAYRMYEGALLTVRPFLPHRINLQKAITAGLEESAKTEGVKIQAYRLHEVIEQVRTELKAEIAKANPEPKPAPKPATPTETAPAPSEMKPKVVEKPKEEMKPKETPKPTPPPVKVEPAPVVPKPVAGPSNSVSGVVKANGVTIKDAELKFVSLDLARARIFNGKTDATGKYTITGPLPASKYLVIVSGKDVPAKFTGTESPLREMLSGGDVTLDFNLE
jgi:hypothetical protein